VDDPILETFGPVVEAGPISSTRSPSSRLMSSALAARFSPKQAGLGRIACPTSSARSSIAFATSRPPEAMTRAISPVRMTSASFSAVARPPSVWSILPIRVSKVVAISALRRAERSSSAPSCDSTMVPASRAFSATAAASAGRAH
jgi:hypothetical protein